MTPEATAQFVAFGRLGAWVTWISAAAIFVFLLWGKGSSPQDRSPASVLILGLLIFGIAALWALFQRQYFKKWVRLWATLEIVLGEDFILRRQEDHPEIRVRREEITHLYDLGKGGLIVRAGHRYRQIVIPHGMEGYEELRSQLYLWKQPEPATQQRLYWILMATGVFGLTLAHVTPYWTSRGQFIVLGHAVAALSFLLVFLESQRSPHVDSYSRRLSWVFFLLAVLEAWAVYNRLAG